MGHRGFEVTVHRPVLGSLGQLVDSFLWTKERHLVVAEGDGEPPIVAVDDLNAVVSGAGDVEHAGVAGDHLLVLTLSTRIMNNNI